MLRQRRLFESEEQEFVVAIDDSYFKDKPNKQPSIYEKWKVKAVSRAGAAQAIWSRFGDKLLKAMKPVGRGLRRISLYVNDPEMTGKGNLLQVAPVTVYNEEKSSSLRRRNYVLEAEWKEGDPVPKGYKVVFGKLAKLGGSGGGSGEKEMHKETHRAVNDAFAAVKSGKAKDLNSELRKAGVDFENESFPNAVPKDYIVTTYGEMGGKPAKFRWWDEGGKAVGRMIMDWKGQRKK